jgi:hypothetical protein
MSSLLSTWLQLREPADTAARSDSLTGKIAETLESGETVRVLDLATGTGSNLRYLAPHLPCRQSWLMVDRDSALLALLPDLMSSWGAGRRYTVATVSGNECVIDGGQFQSHVETRSLDLNVLDELDIFAGRQLVTASALLDLVSETWLGALAARCREVGAAALFALTYNGWSACSPEEPEDEMIRHLLNTHQKTDKGLGGPAAGPDAAGHAARCFADVGYRVWTEPSNWMLGPAERELQRRLIDGWARAATELVPDEMSGIAQWRARRIAHVEAGRSRIVVGHFDVAAIIR